MKKKKKNKRNVNKSTRGNVTDGGTVHQPADQIASPSDFNLSSASAMSLITDNKSDNNNNKKVGTVPESSSAAALSSSTNDAKITTATTKAFEMRCHNLKALNVGRITPY